MLEAATDPEIENSAPVEDKVALWEQIAMVEFAAGVCCQFCDLI